MLADVHFDFSNIGWDAAVAIGTGVLALSTGALAAYTAKLAKKTSDMAEDERDAAKARTRPVLMPPSEVRAVISRINSDTEPIALRLALVNAGVGPALNAYAYAVVATSAGSVQTRLATIGSVAPDHSADIVIPDVPDHDAGDFDDNAYLAVYITVVYNDLGDRTYHSVIGLLDPDRGLALQPRTGFISGPRTLKVLATEVGEGDAPPPQWRVTFTGPDITEDQRTDSPPPTSPCSHRPPAAPPQPPYQESHCGCQHRACSAGAPSPRAPPTTTPSRGSARRSLTTGSSPTRQPCGSAAGSPLPAWNSTSKRRRASER